MAADTYRIVMGAYGWLHQAWSTDFYPDDLPEEWQLGFYGNEFPVVMFPAHYWDNDDETLQEWMEDSGEDLRIICEFDSIAHYESNKNRLKLIGDRCCGIVCKTLVTELSEVQLAQFDDIAYPLCLDLAAGDYDDLPNDIKGKVQQLTIGFVCNGVETSCQFKNGALAIAKVDCTGLGMRELRTLVETMLAQTDETQMAVIIFSGNPPDIELIRNAQIMLELY